MTLSISNQYPAPAATGISPFVRPSFSVVTDAEPIDLTTLNVWVDGRHLVTDGEAPGATRVESDGLGGVHVFTDPERRLPEQQSVGIRVTADDTAAGSPIDVSWLFTTADARGPVINSAEPPLWSITTGSPTDINLQIADPGTGVDPVTATADFVANPADIEHTEPEVEGGAPAAPANQISFDPGSGTGFVGMEGRLIEVNSGVDAGERRRIVSVQGPGLATYDGAQLTGTAESVTVFTDTGLDVVVDGVLVLQSGFLDPDASLAGWTAIVTVNPPVIDVALTTPLTWSEGERVNVGVKAADANGVSSDIDYFFDVIDIRGPQIVNVVPDEGSKGLDGTASPNSDIQFDIVCMGGVAVGTLNVEVNGVAAITAGAGVGDWSGSTVSTIDASTERVTLIRGNAYVDGDTVFVDVQVSDNSARAGERRVMRFHYGATDGVTAVNSGLGGTDVVRVIAYDLSQSSFGLPRELGHTGYAYNGIWYDNGSPSPSNVASWHTELGNFPLSGHIIVTADNGWAVVKELDSGPWMTCVPETSPAWSMADNDTLSDADFGPDAVLALAGANVLFVDFTRDRAVRYNAAGKTLGLGNVTGRDGDQSGAASDSQYALPMGPYSVIGAHWGQDDLVFVVGSATEISVVQEISSELETLLRGREGTSNFPLKVGSRAYTGTWVRARIGSLDDADNLTSMVLAYNETGQGQVEIWDWFQFLLPSAAPLAFIDDASSPALAAAEIRDMEISHTPTRLAVAAVMVGELDVIDWLITPQTGTVQAFSETDLGLNGVASAEMSAVALEPGFVADQGHLYAAVSAPADGRVTRFRVHSPGAADRFVVVDSGQPVTTLSSIGARHEAFKFVNTSMDVV